MEVRETEQGDNLQMFRRPVIYIDIYRFLKPFLTAGSSNVNATHPRYAPCISLPGLDTGGWQGKVRGGE